MTGGRASLFVPFLIAVVFPCGAVAMPQSSPPKQQVEKPKKVFTNQDIEKGKRASSQAASANTSTATPVPGRPAPQVDVVNLDHVVVTEKTSKKVSLWFLPTITAEQRKLEEETARAYQLYSDEMTRFNDLRERLWLPAREAYDSATNERDKRAALRLLDFALQQTDEPSKKIAKYKEKVSACLSLAASKNFLMPSMADGVLDQAEARSRSTSSSQK